MNGKISIKRGKIAGVAKWHGGVAFLVTIIAGCMLLAPTVGFGEDTVQVKLTNGSSIKADLLDRTEERLVLDLGFVVLTVPVSAVTDFAPETEKDVTLDDTSMTEETSSSVSRIQGASDAARPPTGHFKEMVEDLKEAVVVVSNPGGHGAGFLLDSTGRLMTNHHVVRGQKDNDVTIFLRKPGGDSEKKVFRKVEVIAFSSLLDCALLKIPDEELDGVDLPTLPLAPANSLETGMDVYAIGNPGVGAKVLKQTSTQGILSSGERNFNDIIYLQTTAAVNPGNSGGPLLNNRGEVIGLVTFKAFFQEGLAFALPVSYLSHFLEHADAFAPAHDTKNTGFRYHDPMADLEEQKQKLAADVASSIEEN